jgi:hypothetical protein
MTSTSTDTRTPARVAAGAAVLFGVSIFATVASVNVPHKAGDADLLAWWEDSGNVTTGVTSMAFAVLTAVLFAVVANHLVLLAGDRSPRLAAFARSMVGAFTATMLVSAALRGVIGHLTRVEKEPLPGLDVLRYSTALNYTVLGVAAMGTFGLAVLALGALALRTGTLAHWAALLNLGCGAIVLVAVAALLGAFAVPAAILWGLTTAVAILRAPVASAVVEHREPVGTMTA